MNKPHFVTSLKLTDMREEDLVTPVITITHTGKATEKVLYTRNLVGVGVINCPNDIAQAFLEFICINNPTEAMYTDENLRTIANVICEINQKCYRAKH
jgi:hypothetical protein